MATAADVANLQTVYSNLCALLAEITTSPQPSYSENGRSFSWSEYYNMVMEKLSRADTALLASTQAAAGPYENRA